MKLHNDTKAIPLNVQLMDVLHSTFVATHHDEETLFVRHRPSFDRCTHIGFKPGRALPLWYHEKEIVTNPREVRIIDIHYTEV